jgi:predicted DNA-binding transcriptional regulator YafY
MPKNKDALIRYRIINRCLIDYKYVSMEKLLEVCREAFDNEVARRTIEKDIHDMRFDSQLGYYAPIRFDAYRGAYFYDDQDYSIDKIPLDYYDLEALSFASALLDQYKSIGIFTTFSGAVQKIMNTMKIHRYLEKHPDARCVGFENFPVIRGQELLPVILDAILGQKALSIDHQRFDTDETHHHTLHPYYLKEYRNRWYVVGYTASKKQIQSFGLERISSLRVLDGTPFVSRPFDPEAYFRDCIGVMVAAEPAADITLRFMVKQGMYILTQPIHESQKVVDHSKDHITVSLHVVPSFEFLSLVTGWGAAVEVLSPVWLREKVAGILRESLERYQ